MVIDVVTIFPEMFQPFLGSGMIRIARARGLLHVDLWNLRAYASDRHRKVDDRPYGGGPGMVLKPEPVFRAVEEIEARRGGPGPRILLTPEGQAFRDATARELAREERLLLVAGRYEGFDERIRLGLRPREISIGDYVLTGGELPAMVVIDAVARWLPGVLGDQGSAAQDSFAAGLLDHPHYTRPAEFRGMAVPEVLRSGDHGAIERWRRETAAERTRERRSDLLGGVDREEDRGRRDAGGPGSARSGGGTSEGGHGPPETSRSVP